MNANVDVYFSLISFKDLNWQESLKVYCAKLVSVCSCDVIKQDTGLV